MMCQRLMILLCVTCILAAGYSESQDLPREIQWSEDLDYLIERLQITHPNLYANISREAFLEYANQLKQRIPAASDVEMVFGVQELLARIKNTHTLCNSILFMSDNEALKAQSRFYPVMYFPFDDGLYVVATADLYEAILGKKVVRIGKLTSYVAMRELARFVAADNSMTTLANTPRFFLNDGQLLRYIGASDSPDSVTLSLENEDGGAFSFVIGAVPSDGIAGIRWLSMAAESGNPPPLYRMHPRENYWFQHLPEQHAIYLQINLMYDMDSEPFAEFCRRVFDTLDANGADKLIVDVRSCPGGDHIELPLLKGILARPHIDHADHLFLIIGRTTGSASQHLTSEFEHYTSATLFGEATASKPNQYGAMQQFTLPHSKLEIACPLKYFQDTEPSDYSMASTPDIYVPKISSDFRENRDPVMERIFTYDSYKHLKPDFRELMSKAYMDSGLNGFKRVYDSVKTTYVEHGFNMETLLYKALDAWMGDNRRNDEDYVEYLKFIHNELPNSIAVCYDLAYWMNERGDKKEAKRLWEKCLALNPEHHHARWRLALMKLEETWKSRN